MHQIHASELDKMLLNSKTVLRTFDKHLGATSFAELFWAHVHGLLINFCEHISLHFLLQLYHSS